MVTRTIRRAGMLTLATAALSGSLVFGAGTASAATPFTCTGQVFLGQTPTGATQTTLYEGDFGSGTITFTPQGAASGTYNAMGYNTKDNYIYAMRGDNSALWQIDATGAAVGFGPPAGLPTDSYNIGAFDDQGRLWVTASNRTVMYAIDPAANRVVATVNLTSGFNSGDMTFSNGYFWSANANGSVSRINIVDGTVRSFPGIVPGSPFGGAFTYGNGDLGMYDNDGKLYRIAVANPASATPTFTVVSTQAGPASGGNDATSCIAPPVDLSIAKQVDKTQADIGDRLTYTLFVTNNSDTASSGWSVTDKLPDGVSGPWTTSAGCSVDDATRTLSCTGGALAAHDTAQITVTGTVDGTVQTMYNTATVRGNEADPNTANDTSNEVQTELVPMLSAGVAAGALGLLGGGYLVRRRRNQPSA
ncbi:DUF6923 family protein [Amycolatopsis sacchari]|uniref:DUF6923 family protein n=1 Tax=Amycolatopsis sacchari TaxID=115433 RepID=UPI003EBFA75A